MKAMYDKMTLEGKIGPRDENGNMRPGTEYPKSINSADGKTQLAVVNSKREELAYYAQADAPAAATLDEADKRTEVLLEEIRRLKEQNAGMENALKDIAAKKQEMPEEAAKPVVSAKPPSTAASISSKPQTTGLGALGQNKDKH